MKSFIQLYSIEETEQFIAENPLSFLYITQPNCSVCHGLWPQVQNLLEPFPQISLARIDAHEVEAIAGRFSIFAAPVLLLHIEGKEYIRKARIVHLDELEQEISRILKVMNG